MLSSLKHTLIVTTVAALTAFTARAADTYSTSPADTGNQNKADMKTTHFIKQAAQDNETEIALSEIALSKAQNPELKSFAEMLKQDHTQANQQLQPLAQKYGVNIDQELKGKAHREVNKFEKEATGPKFDQGFATFMLKAHQKDVQKFQDAANNLKNDDVRQYAQSILPKLQQHFQRAESVAQAVGVDQATISSYARKLPASVGGTSDEQNKSTKGSGARELKEGTSSGSSSSSTQ